MSDGIITIRKDREKPVINQHPWIFSGAIAKAENAEDGDIVTVVDHKGKFLARGYWNHKSAIQVRILTWHDEPIDEAWWRKMLKRAIDGRFVVHDEHHNWEHMPCRLINAENDYIPGLVVDYYQDSSAGGWIVIQALTLGIDQRKQMLAELIQAILKEYRGVQLSGIYERSDVEVREKEGLKQEKGLLLGEEPPQYLKFQKSEYFLVDIKNGHKTGFYLDQGNNHWLFRELIQTIGQHSRERLHILNLFSYTGAFSVFGGFYSEYDEDDESILHITNVDSSSDALSLAKENVELNDYDVKAFSFIQADVFDYLRQCVVKGEQFDIVVLDPPKFAHNKQQVDKAARGYKDINLNAFKVIKSGGYLMTFSCSGAISRDLFQKIVFGALADSGRQAQIIKHLSASDDHPVALTFPEGEYLKGLLLRVY
jgi:23S rRNA (cytosine1962-C5)-methyltransferase